MSAYKKLIYLGYSLSLLGCERWSQPETKITGFESKKPENEDDRVKVQHILISFKDSLPGRKIQRSKEEAEKLANELFLQVQKNPEIFEDKLRALSDDQVPGIYAVANFGIEQRPGEFPRSSMVKDFGDACFHMKKGELILVPYEPINSPYGYHIIKRFN